MGKRSTNSMAGFLFVCFGASSTRKLSNGQSADHRISDGVVDDHVSGDRVEAGAVQHTEHRNMH